MARIESLKTGQKFKKTEAGEIPVEWEVAKIEDICDVVGGSTPATEEKAYWDGDILWAVPTDITGLQGSIISDTARKITETGLANCAAKLLPEGSLLLTSRATIGACAINTRPMATNQGFASLTCRENVYNWFLFYQIISIKKQLEKFANGSTFMEISKNSIRSLAVSLPPLVEQKKIAEILLSVDNAIEKSSQLIEKKKELKKGLMQKLLTRGIGHRKFYKTKIGEIPEGWEIAPLGKISTEIYRYPTYYNIQYVEKGIPEIRGELIKPNGTLETNISLYRFISEKTAAHFPRTCMQEGDFVVSVRGTMGKVGIVPKSLDGANMTANLIRISPDRNKVYPFWLQQVFISDKFQEQLDTASSSSTIKTIKASELEALNFAVPSLTEQKKIAEILSGVDAEIETKVNEKSKLEKLKKGLMQALLTGKVRVKI